MPARAGFPAPVKRFDAAVAVPFFLVPSRIGLFARNPRRKDLESLQTSPASFAPSLQTNRSRLFQPPIKGPHPNVVGLSQVYFPEGEKNGFNATSCWQDSGRNIVRPQHRAIGRCRSQERLMAEVRTVHASDIEMATF